MLRQETMKAVGEVSNPFVFDYINYIQYLKLLKNKLLIGENPLESKLLKKWLRLLLTWNMKNYSIFKIFYFFSEYPNPFDLA